MISHVQQNANIQTHVYIWIYEIKIAFKIIAISTQLFF